MTKLPEMRERSVVKSSVTASAKYSCSGSFDRFVKGSTTIDSRGTGFIFAEAGTLCGLAGAWTAAGGETAFGHAHQAAIAMAATATRLAPKNAGLVRARRAHPGGAWTAVSGVAATAAALIA